MTTLYGRILLCTFAPFILASTIHFLLRDELGLKLPHDNGVLSETLGVVSLLRTTHEVDSWEPMLRARAVAKTPLGSRLYETVFFKEQTKFQYPPTSLLALEALDRLGLLTASSLNIINRLFFLMNALAIGVLGFLCIRRKRITGDQPGVVSSFERPLVALSACTAALLFWPLVKAIDLGQIQVWIDLAFTLACLAWILDRRHLAGALIGLACAIKPQLGILLIWAVVWRQWSFVKGFLAVAFPILVISIHLYGWHNHWAYLDVLSYIGRHGETLFTNNSINGIVNRLLFNGSNLVDSAREFSPYHPAVYAATLAAFVGFTLLALFPAIRRRRLAPNIFDFGAAALCSVMASPIAWEHHYGIMMPLFVLALGAILDSQSQDSRRTSLALLAASWVLSANYLAAANLLSDSRLNIFQSYLFFGGILLLIILFDTAHQLKTPWPVSWGQKRLTKG